MDKYCQRSNEIRYLMNISSFTIGYGTKCYGMGELIQTRIRTLAPWKELLVSGAGIQTRLTVRYIKEETFTWFYLLSLSFITFTVSKLVCKQIIFLYQAVSHDNKSINLISPLNQSLFVHDTHVTDNNFSVVLCTPRYMYFWWTVGYHYRYPIV